MNKTAALALTALAGLTLTGCSTPGWEGTGTVTELEYMTPEREGSAIDHEGLEITVLTDRGTEASVHVEDCAPDKLRLAQKLTVAEVEKHCGPIGYSQDD